MLALTSPTGGGRSVGIVRSRTEATEFCNCSTLFFVSLLFVVSVVVGMALLTLLEHRALGYIPFGRGPRRFAFVGILHAFRHVVGLLSSD